MIELMGFCYEGEDHLARGASLAPSALRWGFQTGEEYSLLFEAPLPPFRDRGDHTFYDLSPEAAREKALAIMKQNLSPGAPFLLLGGDHTVTYFALEFLNDQGIRPRVLHLDAHLDRRKEYKGWSLSHATVMHRARELLGPGRIYSLGVRTRAPEEEVEEGFFFPYEFLNPLEEILKAHPEERFYLTLDLDVLDPGAFPAVGYPEPAGISLRELYTGLKALRGRILAADMVEYIPTRDPGGVWAQVGGGILKELLFLLS